MSCPAAATTAAATTPSAEGSTPATTTSVTTTSIDQKTQSAVTTTTAKPTEAPTEAPTPEPTTPEPTTPDWKNICEDEDNQLAETHNLVNGGWGVSKILFGSEDAAVVRVNNIGRPVSEPYTGALFFARKYCGADFLRKLADGTVKVDFTDLVVTSSHIYAHYKLDDSATATVVQYSHTPNDGEKGNKQRDQLFMVLSGLSQVSWGNKDMNKCISDNLVVANMDYTEQDFSACLSWQRTVGLW